MRCIFRENSDSGYVYAMCGLDCLHIGQKNSEGVIKEYCCIHVPKVYVNSPIEEWICDLCEIRRQQR